jgi:hypothetical protein
MPARVSRIFRSLIVALVGLAVFGFAAGARPVFAYRELDCGPGNYAQPASILAGVYQCLPRAGAPSWLPPPPQVVTTRDEVGLYLTRLQVRVFHVDFVEGTQYGPALGVPFSD